VQRLEGQLAAERRDRIAAVDRAQAGAEEDRARQEYRLARLAADLEAQKESLRNFKKVLRLAGAGAIGVAAIATLTAVLMFGELDAPLARALAIAACLAVVAGGVALGFNRRAAWALLVAVGVVVTLVAALYDLLQ
jgi:hypothetical protein